LTGQAAGGAAVTTSKNQSLEDRHVAAIYELMALRLRHMTEAVAEFIDEAGGKTDWPRPSYEALAKRYEEIISEWYNEPVYHNCSPGLILALAKFAALINIDRGMTDVLTDNTAITSEEADRHQTTLALGCVVSWVWERDEEIKRAALTGGAA
jgi:hypothetical protein